ncbi:MAG: tetratricopeptide repeat protein [Deltaproteobacteria bacterium]|nr:tetratricopeptide repeat protein [Deltaproteobacteria bacterium]
MAAQRVLGPEAGAELAYRRGLVWLAAGNASAAREPLERAAALAPERVDARLALAQAQVELGEAQAAVATLGGILAVSPVPAELARARRILAAAVRRAEPPLAGEAEQDLTRLLAALERGEANDGDLARATALARSHVHPRVLTVAGLVAWRRGLEREATRLLNEAAALNPLDGEAQRVLGAAHYTAQRPRDALAPLKEALRRNPFDAEVARMLAAAATTEGDLEAAAAAYRRLTVLEPSVAEHHLWLARTERRLGRLSEARLAASRGAALKGDNVPLWVELASLEAQLAHEAPTPHERDDAHQRGQEALSKLMTLAPNHPAAAAITAQLDGKR